MEADDIPDEVWIKIIESVDASAQLAVLLRTCRRLQQLSTPRFLRELCWVTVDSTAYNIAAWRGKYKDMSELPRKLTLGVAFDFSAQEAWVAPTPEMILHDDIYAQISAFKSLHEIVLEGTVVSHHTQNILGSIPTLRHLTIAGCKFIELHTPFSKYNPNSTLADSQFTPLSITHLSLHRLILPGVGLRSSRMKYNRFLRSNNISTLTSLSLTWTAEVNTVIFWFSSMSGHSFPNLAQLDISMPVLNPYGYLDNLSWFVMNLCPLAPRIRLSIESHDLSEAQIKRLRVGVKGLWSYNGPPSILFQFRWLADLTHLVMNEKIEWKKVLDGLEKKLPQSRETLDIKVKEWDDDFHFAICDMFSNLRFVVVRCGDHKVFSMLDSESLEIRTRDWDNEFLFAIRYRFPTLRSLIIQYGSGTIPDDRLMVTLGSEFLFQLPYLHTLKLVYDISCLQTVSTKPISITKPTSAFDHDDVKDYLNAWNRSCSQLRCFQLTKEVQWVRTSEGAQWVKMTSA